MQPTGVVRLTQNAKRFLRSVCILMLLLQAYISRPERAHTSYLLIIYLACILTCSIIPISFDRSRDIFRILDTLPNTTSKHFRNNTWGYASLPPSWSHTAYAAAVVPIVLGIFPTHSIPSRLNQLKCLPNRATIWAESTKSLRKPQHPNTGHPIAFQLGLGLGFESSGNNHVFFVFPTAAA